MLAALFGPQCFPKPSAMNNIYWDIYSLPPYTGFVRNVLLHIVCLEHKMMWTRAKVQEISLRTSDDGKETGWFETHVLNDVASNLSLNASSRRRKPPVLSSSQSKCDLVPSESSRARSHPILPVRFCDSPNAYHQAINVQRVMNPQLTALRAACVARVPCLRSISFCFFVTIELPKVMCFISLERLVAVKCAQRQSYKVVQKLMNNCCTSSQFIAERRQDNWVERTSNNGVNVNNLPRGQIGLKKKSYAFLVFFHEHTPCFF